LAKWLINPIASITSSSQILKTASVSSDCNVSMRPLHDAMYSWLPCVLLNIRVLFTS
jgi:hypothetical protein